MNPLHFDIGMTTGTPAGASSLVAPCRSGLAS
jgi:hypothetical protein